MMMVQKVGPDHRGAVGRATHRKPGEFTGVNLSDSGHCRVWQIWWQSALRGAARREFASRAEAARQSEELKSTLLDAIAHEFKTPLTAINGVHHGAAVGSSAAAGTAAGFHFDRG